MDFREAERVVSRTGDDLVVNETFGGSSFTFNTDHSDQTNDSVDPAGNMLEDARFRYTYDAPALDSRLRQRERAARRGSWRSARRSFCVGSGRS